MQHFEVYFSDPNGVPGGSGKHVTIMAKGTDYPALTLSRSEACALRGSLNKLLELPTALDRQESLSD